MVRIFYFTIVFFLITSFFNCDVIYAQSGSISKGNSLNSDFITQVWNSENGLPQNSIIDIIQTHDGFLWLSSYNSIARFDGSTFKTFNTSNFLGFPNNGVKKMLEDRAHHIWMLDYNGQLLKLLPKKIQSYDVTETNSSITVISEDYHSNLVIGTSTGKLFYFKNEKFIQIAEVAKQSITAIQAINENELYIGTENGLYQLINNKITEVKEFANKSIDRLKKDNDGNLVIYTERSIYTLKKNHTDKYVLPKTIVNEKLPLNDLLIDDENRFWIITKNGITIIQNKTIVNASFDKDFSPNSIHKIFEDKEHNMWVGTDASGLFKLKTKLIKSFSKTEGFLGGSSGAIIQNADKSLLIANYCNNIFQFKNNEFHRFDVGKDACFWSLLNDKQGNLWTGSFGSGVLKYKDKKIEQLTPNKTIKDDKVFAIYEDSNGKIWLGGENGIYYYKDGELFSFEDKKIHGPITQFIEDKHKHIWFCSKTGLGKIENNNVKLYTTADGLSDNNVRSIYEDNDGAYWIATYGGGINRLKNETFFSFNKQAKFMDDFTSCILEDDNGKLWISSNHGIYSALRSDLASYADGKSPFLNINYHGKQDGMTSTECNGGFQSSGLKDIDGYLWFPTTDGIVMIDPKKATAFDYTHELIIEKIVADNVTQNISDLHLSTNTTKLEFQYNVPFFNDSKNLLFQYKLDGKDSEWSEPTSTKIVSFHNLDPGNYIFRVRIYGSFNTNLNKEKKVLFIIPFPFWRTNLFISIVFILCISLISLIIYLRIRHIKLRELKKVEINKNYATLELKALQSQMNPHFIFNCLNTIKYFIAIDDKASANKYLGKFSKLIRMFLEHSNNNYISLEAEINLLTLYIELEQLRLENGFEYTLSIDPQLNLNEIEIPGMLFQPLVENAIHHGLRELTHNGILNLIFDKKENKLVGTIRDNGIGRLNSLAKKGQDLTEHTSLGLKSIEERIKTINYIKGDEIKINVIDEINNNNEPIGTSITITIPLNTN